MSGKMNEVIDVYMNGYNKVNKKNEYLKGLVD